MHISTVQRTLINLSLSKDEQPDTITYYSTLRIVQYVFPRESKGL